MGDEKTDKKVSGLFPFQCSLFPNSLINLSRIFQNREKAKTILWEKDGEEVKK